MHSKRRLTWQLTEPGRIFRNDFTTLYIEVVEQEPWKGEPLYLTTQRTQARNGSGRTNLTDAATRSLSAQILPIVIRYGFSRAWAEAFGARMAGSNASIDYERRRAQAEATWWQLYADLADMAANGLLDFVPLPTTQTYGREHSIDRAHTPGTMRPRREHPTAEARFQGELVGYMTREGSLLPPDDVLRVERHHG